MPRFSATTKAVEENVSVLREAFYCDPSSPSGLRHAKMKRAGGRIGEMAGSCNPAGYWRVSCCGISLMAHRVVFILTQGPIPEGFEVDHKDGNTSNNNSQNLQALTNGANRRAINRKFRNNTSGFHGVGYNAKRRRWKAYICRENKPKALGYFRTPEDAARAYDNAAILWAATKGEVPRFLNAV
jgi:hypothetical protein